MTHGIKTLALAAMVLLGSSAAMAQSAGTWMVKGGVNRIEPHVTSGNLSAPSLPNSQVDVKADTAAILTGAYMLTDAFSLEFYAGLPYEHEIVGAGSLAGVGKLGTVKQVSPTLFAQYRFLEASSAWRPYVGAGLTYAYFYGEEGSGTLTALTNPGGPPTQMSVDSAFGFSSQLGLTVRVADRWYLDGSVVKTFLKNKTTLSTGQSIDTKLDPVSVNLSVGYMF
ncbi:MAG TPA: OmpW family outer membrane protein [Rhizobacter sp.]|nr:OmpW family outer membrane protein [Rhizobacter sp.]